MRTVYLPKMTKLTINQQGTKLSTNYTSYKILNINHKVADKLCCL